LAATPWDNHNYRRGQRPDKGNLQENLLHSFCAKNGLIQNFLNLVATSFGGHTSYSQVFPQLCKTGLLEPGSSHFPNPLNKRYARFIGLILARKQEQIREGGGLKAEGVRQIHSEPRTPKVEQPSCLRSQPRRLVTSVHRSAEAGLVRAALKRTHSREPGASRELGVRNFSSALTSGLQHRGLQQALAT